MDEVLMDEVLMDEVLIALPNASWLIRPDRPLRHRRSALP